MLLLLFSRGAGCISFSCVRPQLQPRLLGFCFHALGIGLGRQSLRAGLLSLRPCFFGWLAALRFSSRILPGFGFAIFSSFLIRCRLGLGFFLHLLLHGHYAGFFGGAHCFARQSFNGGLVALLDVGFLGLPELLRGIVQD